MPKNAGIDSEEGFDLSTMHVLMRHMGMPHLAAPVVHIAVSSRRSARKEEHEHALALLLAG